MKWDDLLGKIKVNRKPMSLHRLTWWIVIILARLFGRKVHVEGGKSLRIFPIVWKGKIHLCGVEHQIVVPDFVSPYTLRLKRVPHPAVTEGRPANIVPSENNSIAHV